MPENLQNGYWKLQGNEIRIGVSTEAMCAAGYILSGPRVMFCAPNGRWVAPGSGGTPSVCGKIVNQIVIYSIYQWFLTIYTEDTLNSLNIIFQHHYFSISDSYLCQEGI